MDLSQDKGLYFQVNRHHISWNNFLYLDLEYDVQRNMIIQSILRTIVVRMNNVHMLDISYMAHIFRAVKECTR